MGGSGHIAGYGNHPCQPGQFGAGRFQRLSAASIDNQCPSLLRQCARQRQPQTARSAGNQNCTSLLCRHCLSFPSSIIRFLRWNLLSPIVVASHNRIANHRVKPLYSEQSVYGRCLSLLYRNATHLASYNRPESTLYERTVLICPEEDSRMSSRARAKNLSPSHPLKNGVCETGCSHF